MEGDRRGNPALTFGCMDGSVYSEYGSECMYCQGGRGRIMADSGGFWRETWIAIILRVGSAQSGMPYAHIPTYPHTHI